MLPRVLLVEPNTQIAVSLLAAGGALGTVEHCQTFEAARATLAAKPFDFVVTNLRLNDFNGLHLVHLVSGDPQPPRSIVYTDVRDAALAREVQRSGAFYETAESLPVTLAAYVQAALPPADRRNPARPDRRGTFRGGRRCWDEYVLHQQST